MSEDDRVAAFIEDVLARSRIPSRRELHFDDVARARGSIDAAFAEFGLAHDVASRLRVVYRTQQRLAHALRVTAGLTVSLAVALGIKLAMSRPGAFRGMAGLASLIVLILVLWRELVARRLRQPTAVARVGRWLAAFLALATWEYGIHHYAGIPIGVLRAAGTGGVFIVVGASTAIIMAGADRAFTALIHPREG